MRSCYEVSSFALLVFSGCSKENDIYSTAFGDVLFNGWSALNHSRLLMNASLWLADL